MDFKWFNEGQIKTDGNKIENICFPHKAIFFFNNGRTGEEGNYTRIL